MLEQTLWSVFEKTGMIEAYLACEKCKNVYLDKTLEELAEELTPIESFDKKRQ